MKPRESDAKGRAWALLLTTHATLVERIEAALGAADLPPLAWYDVLWELEKAEDGKMRMSELAERVVLSRSNLTRLADRLEKAKLLRRESCADDKRGAYCAITKAGLQMREKMWPVYREQIDLLFGAYLDVEEARTMTQVFEKILRAAKEVSPPN
ncbi:MAG: MarR family transcriptional regulator [Proteobacteria bacterium]|nr:MarR family transcriptional regulator [Pseudomonadota bacterium]